MKMYFARLELCGVLFCFLLLAGCERRTSSNDVSMNASSPNVTRISDAQFEVEVTKAASPVVVEFYAIWCEPCKVLAPIVEEIAASFTNKVKFVKMNLDEATVTAKQFHVEGVPTLLFLKNGKLVNTVIALETNELKKHIDALVQTNLPASPAM